VCSLEIFFCVVDTVGGITASHEAGYLARVGFIMASPGFGGVIELVRCPAIVGAIRGLDFEVVVSRFIDGHGIFNSFSYNIAAKECNRGGVVTCRVFLDRVLDVVIVTVEFGLDAAFLVLELLMALLDDASEGLAIGRGVPTLGLPLLDGEEQV